MWNPKIPPDIIVYSTPVARSQGTMCLIRYHMIKITIKHGIHISTCHGGKSWLGRVSGNKQHVAELPHDVLRKLRIRQMWPTSQPSRLEGNVLQGMCLTMIDVRMEVYILCYHALKIHFVWLCSPIPSERYKSMWHTLSVGQNTWSQSNICEKCWRIQAWKWYIWIISKRCKIWYRKSFMKD